MNWSSQVAVQSQRCPLHSGGSEFRRLAAKGSYLGSVHYLWPAAKYALSLLKASLNLLHISQIITISSSWVTPLGGETSFEEKLAEKHLWGMDFVEKIKVLATRRSSGWAMQKDLRGNKLELIKKISTMQDGLRCIWQKSPLLYAVPPIIVLLGSS